MTYDTSPASPQRIELSGRESLFCFSVFIDIDVGFPAAVVNGVYRDRHDILCLPRGNAKLYGTARRRILCIGKLSLDGGELHVDGRIDAIAFEDAPSSRGGLLSRLFGG